MPFAAGRNAAFLLDSSNTGGSESTFATVEMEDWEVNREVVEDEVTNSGSGIQEETLPIREKWSITGNLPWLSTQVLERVLGLNSGQTIMTDTLSANAVWRGYVGDVLGVAARTVYYTGVVRITRLNFVTNPRKAARFRIEMRGLSLLYPPGASHPALSVTSYPVGP